jgi:hypothetical protein
MNPDADSLGEPSREELIALIRAQAAEIAALKARIADCRKSSAEANAAAP